LENPLRADEYGLLEQKMKLLKKEQSFVLEDLHQLAETIQHIFENYHEAERTAWSARQKCVENYSFTAMEEALLTIFMKYENCK